MAYRSPLMRKTGYVRVTGITPPMVNGAISKIIHESIKYHVDVKSRPSVERVHWPKKRARFCGCEEIDLKRKVFAVLFLLHHPNVLSVSYAPYTPLVFLNF